MLYRCTYPVLLLRHHRLWSPYINHTPPPLYQKTGIGNIFLKARDILNEKRK